MKFDDNECLLDPKFYLMDTTPRLISWTIGRCKMVECRLNIKDVIIT